MLKNYLTLGFRALIRNLEFSTINIIGLSTGMAACFVLIQFARYESGYDSFHHKANNIFRLSLRLTTAQGSITDVPKNFSALAPALQREFPDVENYARVFPVDGTIAVTSGNVAFNEKDVIFADASFFDVFDFKMIHGDPHDALVQPNAVVLSQRAAKRYFGSETALGKQITMREGEVNLTLAVTGVIADVPENSHLPFDIVVSHATLRATWGERADNSWNEALFYTYILTKPQTNNLQFVSKLTPDLLMRLSGWNNAARIAFVVQPLRDIYLTSHMVQEARINGNSTQVKMLWVISIAIVLLSWINYINLSTARYLERAKEVGVRKVIGASKAQLTLQFITESVIMTIVSILGAVILVQALSPVITTFAGKTIPFWDETLVLLSMFSMFILGAIIAATCPALILSSLRVTNIIKGAFKTSSSGQQFRHGLIVFQFMTAAVIIGSTFIVYQQLRFMRSAELGTDVAATLILPSPDITDSTYASRASYFKSQLAKADGIESVVSSTSIPGKVDNIVQGGLVSLENSSEEGAMHYRFGVDRQYIGAYGMNLLAGRDFAATGDQSSVILNETAIRKLGYADAAQAIGHEIAANWTPKATIIGVVADFHQHSLKSAIDPAVFILDESASFGYFSVRIKGDGGAIDERLSTIREAWNGAFAGNPFDFFFLDTYYEKQYQDDVRFGNVLVVFSALGLLIACLGIFGLAVFNAAQRVKEISIRKVLGASVKNILVILSLDYFKLIVMALIIAAPLTYYLSDAWLSTFAYRISISWWMLMGPGALIIIVALITISSQSMKAVSTNPTRHLNG